MKLKCDWKSHDNFKLFHALLTDLTVEDTLQVRVCNDAVLHLNQKSPQEITNFSKLSNKKYTQAIKPPISGNSSII